MKIQISKQLLTLAINRVQGAISDRSQAQIGLRGMDNVLEVTAADSVMAVYCTPQCEVIQAGMAFVPARLFTDMARELPDGVVKMELEGATIRITAGANEEFTMKIPVQDNATWRTAPKFNSRNAAEIPANRLAYLIEQVQFCVTPECPRVYGSVAYLHRPSPGTFRLVGTDGFRLSYCELQAELPEEFLRNGISLSKRGVTELHRMCDEGFPSLRLSISEDETTLVAEVPDYWIFLRLSQVKYPNYLGVVPSHPMTGVMVSRNHLQNVAKRVLIAADKSRALQLCFSESSLTLNSKTMGSSEGRERVPLADYHGPQYDIAVNGKFLTDIFTTTESNDLTLHFNQQSNEDPIVIVPKQEPSDCRSRHVLVPIKQTN